MKLTTAGKWPGAGDVSPQTLEDVFADDARRGEFVILEADQSTFLQASGEEDGPYVLEYREAGEQFQAVGQLTKQEVKEAFLGYLQGGSEWRTKKEWSQLPIRKGCFKQAALLLLLAVACLGVALLVLHSAPLSAQELKLRYTLKGHTQLVY
jgi:hypothetical protein